MRKKIPIITDPEHISRFKALLVKEPSLDIFQSLTQNQYSKNSLLAIRTDWLRYLSFCQTAHITVLPASIIGVRRFLETEAKQRKFASIKRYSVTIGLMHTLLSLPNPVAHRQIKQVLISLRFEKNGDAKQAIPLTTSHLKSLQEIMTTTNELADIRDLAIYYVMFECALKRSELKMLTINDVYSASNQGVQIQVGHNKYRLSTEATACLNVWLGIYMNLSKEGLCPLFCSIDRHQNLSHQPLDDSSIYRILRRASDRLNLSDSFRFSGQSTRVGAVQELKNQGLKIKEIQEFGRWLSPAMPAQYMGNTDTAEKEKIKFIRIKNWE
ncbi:hypothetical protein BCU68_15865 [Vibrio sp. 10N.286.49.B3]|uniref:tyrosine-type recombinase/integrase n=1 Tax=Vibrio sp. 10N.286.49.B3 TaxID=1880855 RepID=UPI000C835703|nr:tyrosine-type recombinase/integrase [Vibrio sp. 10N.286.49.B3]PMH41431.1 hypothetical protein BCU68_15865 [Vibrio sp. 10N.286.49.B3]